MLPSVRDNADLTFDTAPRPEVCIIASPVIHWPAYARTFGAHPCNAQPDVDVCLRDMEQRNLVYVNLFSVVLNVQYQESILSKLAFGHLSIVKIADGNYFIAGSLSDWRSFILTYAQKEWSFSVRLLADTILLIFDRTDFRRAFADFIKKTLTDQTFTVRKG